MKFLGYIVALSITLLIGTSAQNSIELIKSEQESLRSYIPTYEKGILEPIVDMVFSDLSS